MYRVIYYWLSHNIHILAETHDVTKQTVFMLFQTINLLCVKKRSTVFAYKRNKHLSKLPHYYINKIGNIKLNRTVITFFLGNMYIESLQILLFPLLSKKFFLHHVIITHSESGRHIITYNNILIKNIHRYKK